MNRTVQDVRQSPPWAKYLEALNWKCIETSTGIKIQFRSFIVGNLAKLQKPRPLLHSDLDEIDAICKKNKIFLIKLEPGVGQDEKLLKFNGYVASTFPLTPSCTFYIDLSKTEGELWEAISHSGKYAIKRAEREGTRVDYISNPDELALKKYYEILKFTGQKKKFYVPPYNQIRAQVKAFGDKSYIIFVYDKDSNVSGAKLYVGYDDFVLYTSGGTTANGRDNKAGYELLWKSILYFKSLGYKTLDLEGKDDIRFPWMTQKWGGFSHFKEKFGGEVITFPVPYVKYHNRLVQWIFSLTGFSI